MALVTVQDLLDYMSGIDLNEDQWSAVQGILNGLETHLGLHLNRALTRGPHTETVYSDYRGLVRLWNTPVTKVVSVTCDWYPAYDGDAFTQLDPSTVFVPLPQTLYTATYYGGLDDTQLEACRLSLLRVAAREVEQRHDDTLTVKDLTTRNEGEIALRQRIGWQEDELKVLDRLRKRVLV